MHITSLPGPYGIGTLGKNAYAFVDFLRDAGQSYWQILPLTPTGYGDSPYQSCSTFAGNHYLIDLDKLREQGLIWDEDLQGIDWGWSAEKVDFGKQYENRLNVLRKAYQRFGGNGDFDWFCQENGWWLADFALFMALKGKFGGAPWYQWEDALKFRHEDAMNSARAELADEIRFYSFVQYIFYKQWNDLRNYAHNNGVSIIGDVPIYVPYDSVEVWSNPEMFQLNENLDPIDVAGCPPDAFSADGQLWGNPLYRWDVIANDGFAWWLRRLGAAGNLYDVIRMDHFRGFEAYWAVPFHDTTARNGRWVKGPEMAFINAVKNGTEIPTDYCGTIATGSVALTEINTAVAAAGTAEAIEAAKAKLQAGTLNVFDVSTFTVNGAAIPEDQKADVDTDSAFTPDTDVVDGGYYHESEYRSAPYFDINIDGINRLDKQ
jgi:4-alpha-glucanotransferase